jgi:nucleoside 2-deoxyribosyltransferase
MKIYIAAWFGSLERQREHAKKFQDLGHEIVSSWLREEVAEPAKAQPTDFPFEYMRDIATRDVWEIAACDALIIDTLDVSSRGGREVELGMALALNKSVALVGPRRNVFHYMLDTQFNSWEELFDGIRTKG